MVDTSPNSWKLLYESGRQALQDRKLQEAEQSFSAALQLAEDFAGSDPRLVATLNALARIYSLQRRYLAAAALLNRLLEVTERTLGPSHVQVAGVLTNLAEMYTHLGAAREELELRERVLGIRGDDPNADATSIQRLHDRVNELRALLAAQETTVELDEEFEEPLPTVRTSEYSSPATTEPEPEAEIVLEPTVASQPAFSPASASSVTRDDSYRFSPANAQPSVAPVAAIAAALSAPIDETVIEDPETFSYDGEPKSAVKASPVVELISIEEQSVVGTIDHGFSDMGRDELPLSAARKIGGRSSLYSIAAGIVLVAGLLAARDYVKSPDDERMSPGVSPGSVSLASAPARVVVTPVAQAVAPTTPAPAPTPEPRTVERLIADRHAEEPRRSTEATSRSATEDAPTERAPRVPSAAELEKTLKSLDAATKAIDQRTKAVTDSVSAIRLQAPTFKKVRMADPTTGPVIP